MTAGPEQAKTDRDAAATPRSRRPRGLTLSASLAERISAAIQRGAYRPGERLVEKDLMAQFGVSRGSIREALRRLEANHFVRFEPNRGAMVTRPGPQELVAMLRIRGEIVGIGARMAAERVGLADHRARVAALLPGIEEELAGGGPAHHRECNAAFHAVLNEVAGTHYVGKLVETVSMPMLYDVYFRELTDEQWRVNLDDHRDLVRAVAAGDGDAAHLFARRHMLRMVPIVEAISGRWLATA